MGIDPLHRLVTIIVKAPPTGADGETMYRIRYEGGISSNEKQAIEDWVPATLNKTMRESMSVGDGLISRWFGNAAIGSKAFNDKREKMKDYVLNRCQVMTFVKKLYGKKVDAAEVEEGDFAQVIRSCFGNDPTGFVPSGVRIYVLGTGMIDQDSHERFNTITHELTHRVIGTTDWVYGKKSSLKLAQKNSAKALDCAENWGYFYQELMERI